jgi:hypothetical protein
MMRRSSSLFGASVLMLALVWLSVGVGTASAQVPYDMSYQGRLTDAVGAPLAGPATLELRVFDSLAGGVALYEEVHIGVSLDDSGAFSIRMGAGDFTTGTFDAALFSGVNRYLEVVVASEVLTPRLVMGSVPYAMQAESAPAAEAAADSAQTAAAAAQTTADANTTGISTNATAISGNTSNISTNTAGIASNDTDIAANAVETSANTSGISANAAGISTNATAISGNTSNISTNTTNIATNTTAISGNTVDTSANTTGISTNATAITGEATDRAAADAAHATAISGNTAGISTNATALAALEARIAALEPPPPPARFVACADGVTVEDTATGLLWERKTTTGDLHDVTNTYNWSSTGTGTAADGSAYTVFLLGLNEASFAGHTNWRLPIISEFQSILVGPGVEAVVNADPADPNSGLNGTGQATICAGPPCIDPDFAALGGPTASGEYWSASSIAGNLRFTWNPYFNDGTVWFSQLSKNHFRHVRAVRTGSCSS